jgi:alpha-ketoglutarate-dependent taurine dioxygenase
LRFIIRAAQSRALEEILKRGTGMSESNMDKQPLKRLGAVRRQPVVVSGESVVAISFFDSDKRLPAVIRPAMRGVDLIDWASANREFIEANLLRHGGLLFRDFKPGGPADFESFIKAVSAGPLEYTERSSPRSQVAGNIYTSTDYPADQPIFLHNENSYQNTWPLRIFFYCEAAPEEGGETPIADVRRVFERIDPIVRNRFIEKGWMVVRNFGDGLGLSWQTVFQTTDRAAVDEHCRKNGIEVEWKSGDKLRTRAIRPAVAKHPRTREMVWFNHAAFFHPSTLGPNIHDMLLAEFTEEGLPSMTYYGDGARIEPEALEHLRDAYRKETVAFPWQRGDILMLDNMLVAHGRSPYSGPRKILVGMAEATSDRGV